MSDEEGKNDILGKFSETFSRGEYSRKQQLELARPYLSELDEYVESGNGKWKDHHKDGVKGGWKFHLNVEPHNVIEVSKFLKDKGFNHKYLSGGEVDSGKIFTVSTGSKKMTERSVRLISDNVGNLLAEPKARGEALFAPNITGRFEGSGDKFHNKACKDGIVIAREKMKFFDEPKFDDEDVEYSRKELLDIYGRYFGGSISYYNPEGNLT